MTTTTKPRRRAKLTPSAQHYLDGELRWQAELRKRRAKAPAPLAIKRARSDKLMAHRPSAAERDEMVRKGVSMLDGSHRIQNAAELRRVIRSVEYGRSVEQNLVRHHAIRRAAGLGLSSWIPQTWHGDGRLK